MSAFDRDKAREELRKRGVVVDEPMTSSVEKLLDSLEACVAPTGGGPDLSPLEAMRVLKWWANAGDRWDPSEEDDALAARLDFAVETHYLRPSPPA